ncbi:unnamed protein product [Schistocephalus solidus]|uniref:Zeta_toxin domain-containing protein n=1 Tax=Schistocephalus solidus TaxID=70667 RepID=A0A183SPX0_SCHSO|nr:unnamed protein product [Schistocephalus solidus]
MSIFAKKFISILQEQQAQFKAAHFKMMESMMQQFNLHFPDQESSGKQSTLADAVAAGITEIIYNPDSCVTFDAWFKRCEDIFRAEGAPIITKIGHKRSQVFTRLQFGAKTAPATHQQTMDTMLTGTEGTGAYLNDIIVTGSNAEKLLQRLETALCRAMAFTFI